MSRNRWIAMVFVAMACACQVASAVTVRGKLLRGSGVAPGVAVTVRNQQQVRSPPAYSGANGLYYIPNVMAGTYVLEVWGKPNTVTYTLTIQVKDSDMDVNPVYVP
jgi:hypothetical protein